MKTQSSGTDTRRRRGAPSPEPVGVASPEDSRAALGPTMALTATLAVACFVAVLGAVLPLVEPQPIPGIDLAQRQDAESGLYLVAFAVILPLALVVAPRIADAIAAGPNARALSALTAFLVATMAVAMIAARILPGATPEDALVAIAVWWLVAAVVLARARARRPWPRALSVARFAPVMWAFTATAVVGALLAFTDLGSVNLIVVLIGAVALGLVLVGYGRRAGVTPPRLSRGWGLVADTAIIVALVLAIPDLVVFEPGAGLLGYQATIIQFHQNFLLGPANQVLAGDAVLVDTASQYGVAPIYLLAGWFQLAPIGHGTAAFLDGALYALVFAGGYGVLRLSGVTRLLSAVALAFAVIVLLYNLLYPVGGLLQHGPLRFGLPMAVILPATLEARMPDRRRAWRIVQLAVVGLAAIWALEAFVYTAATFAALACLRAWRRPPGGRLRALALEGVLALAACAAAHLLLALATLVFAGQLPDWGQYATYLEAFLSEKVGEITYDFRTWSAGLPVGIAYALSAVALFLLALRRRQVIEQEKVALTALVGLTAYGIALFTYLVNRSAEHIVPYVALPAVLGGALWLSLLMRGALTGNPAARKGGVAFALALVTLVVATAWSSVGERFQHTPLARLAPGGDSLTGAFDRLWSPPPIDARAPQGELLLERYLPGERRVPLIVTADLGIEILMRAERAQDLPFGNPNEDVLIGEPSPALMRRAVADLEPGDRLLMQKSGFDVLAAIERERDRDLLTEPLPLEESLTPQQQWLLARIGERFRLRVIHRDDQGFVVAELEERR